MEGYVPQGDFFVDYDNFHCYRFPLPLPSEGQLSKQLLLLTLIRSYRSNVLLAVGIINLLVFIPVF